MLSERDTKRLLDRLCVKLGFCLPPTAASAIEKNPSPDIIAFTDRVFTEEGLDPITADLRLYRQVRDMVSQAFRESDDRITPRHVV